MLLRITPLLLGLALLGRALGARADEGKDADAAPLVATSVARVRIEAKGDRAVVEHDVTLVRGGGGGGDATLYVAFGAPGVPTSFEARLVSVPKGLLDAARTERGEPLEWTYERRRPKAATPLLGRPSMAGFGLHVPAALVERAFAVSGIAVLRLRSVVPLARRPATERGGGESELVVRLADARGPEGRPVAAPVGRIEVALGAPGEPDARFCAQSTPLRVHVDGAPGVTAAFDLPLFAQRATGDDLCVRLPASKP